MLPTKATIQKLETENGRRYPELRRRYNRTHLDGGARVDEDYLADNIVAHMERLKTRKDRIALFEAKLKPIILQSTEDDSKLRKLVAANVKKWGVRPGTQIFYRGAFGTQMLEHHGVYIGYGIVCEVGGKWCKTGQFANGDFRKQCLSFNTLNNFALRGNGVVYEVKYDHIDLDDLGVLREQLKRAIQLTKHSDWNYNPFTHNCQHWSSYVVTGTARITQCDLHNTFSSRKINLRKTESCKNKECRMLFFTTKNNVCAKAPRKGLFGKWCTLDDGSWEYIGSKRAVYGCKRDNADRKSRKVHRCIP